jgi:hypothetical protein
VTPGLPRGRLRAFYGPGLGLGRELALEGEAKLGQPPHDCGGLESGKLVIGPRQPGAPCARHARRVLAPQARGHGPGDSFSDVIVRLAAAQRG